MSRKAFDFTEFLNNRCRTPQGGPAEFHDTGAALKLIDRKPRKRLSGPPGGRVCEGPARQSPGRDRAVIQKDGTGECGFWEEFAPSSFAASYEAQMFQHPCGFWQSPRPERGLWSEGASSRFPATPGQYRHGATVSWCSICCWTASRSSLTEWPAKPDCPCRAPPVREDRRQQRPDSRYRPRRRSLAGAWQEMIATAPNS